MKNLKQWKTEKLDNSEKSLKNSEKLPENPEKLKNLTLI